MISHTAKALAIAFVACLTYSLAQAADLSGVPRIVDGDTLAIGATKVRLQGIDAPETDQVCLNANGAHWTCGIDARDQLAAHIAGQEIICSSNGVDAYRRTLATCYLANEDLNGWLVQEGWALGDWRHRNNKTVILGAFSVPVDAQAMFLGPSATEGAPSPECTIKGNINRNGERIYHTEHQSSYARIKMDKGGDRRWFCTPEEAEAAGWRRAVR
jgi:hypothetical protein